MKIKFFSLEEIQTMINQKYPWSQNSRENVGIALKRIAYMNGIMESERKITEKIKLASLITVE